MSAVLIDSAGAGLASPLAEVFSDAASRGLLGGREARTLFAALDSELFAVFRDEPWELLITSAQSGEGRTTISLLLAFYSALLSENGEPVLLVDACPSQCAVQRLALARTPQPLGGYRDRSPLEAFVTPLALGNLHVAQVYGQEAPELARLPQKALERFFATARRHYGRIFVDTASAKASRDFVALSQLVRNALVVVQYAGPNREQIQVLLQDLDRLGARVLGTVLNKRQFPLPGWLYRN